MNGRHTIPGDRSYVASLFRNIAGAVALVTLVATAFWGIGMMQPTAEVGVAGNGEMPSQGPPVAMAPMPESESDVEPAWPSDLTATPDPALYPSETPTPTPAASPTATVAPSRISVQILDAAGDGGTRARMAASRLRADGYNVVAINQASRTYPRTEVMYSPGDEAKARQIAFAYGFSSVRPKPSNLTNAVDVHLVIGRDYQRR
ncbi:MAG: LytR C-terminal domain-containing protein [Nitriliruptorales bacterium]